MRHGQSRASEARLARSSFSRLLRRLSLVPICRRGLSSDLKSVGDVRRLQGRMVEIHGQVKEYDGRAEIVLEEYRQLGGAGARIPPLAQNYDVEKEGRYSAGTFSHPKAKRKTSGDQAPNVITQAPEDPEQ